MDVRLRGDMLVDGRPVPPDTRAGLLIAYLCLAPNHRIRREVVASEFWEDRERRDQQNSLRQTIHLANRIGEIHGDRTSVWITLSSSDLEAFDNWKPLLADWRHPWAERVRELDRQRYSENTLRETTRTANPIQKIELLKKGLQAHPIDEELCAELIELYQELGWKTEAAIQLRSFDRAIREVGVGLASSKMLGLLRPAQDIALPNRHGLSRHQNIELTLANFPALFASGQLQIALDAIDSVVSEGGTTPEQASKLTYCRVRCLLNMGQATLALENARTYQVPMVSAYDRMLKGYELYLSKQYVQASNFLTSDADIQVFPEELFCDAMSLLATAAIMGFNPELASNAIDEGIKRASEIGYRYSTLTLQALQISSERIMGSTAAHISRYDELIEFATSFGFVLQVNGLLSAKGKALRELSRLVEAETTLLECIESCDRIHNHFGLGIALDYLGETYLSMDRFSDAALQFQRSALLRREFGEHIGVATSYRGAGLALIGLGEYELARKMLRRCLKIYEESGDKLRIGVGYVFLAMAEEHLSPSVAEAALRVGVSALRECGVSPAGIRYELGEVAWARVHSELNEIQRS